MEAVGVGGSHDVGLDDSYRPLPSLYLAFLSIWSQDLASRFSVMPAMKFKSETIVPPIYSIEMHACVQRITATFESATAAQLITYKHQASLSKITPVVLTASSTPAPTVTGSHA